MKKIFTLLLFITLTTTIFAQVATPSFTTATGTYYNPFNVEITGENIYYTLDGTTPTTSSTKYTAAIKISEFNKSTTIKAASYTNGQWSEVVSATYELKVAAPVFSVKGGVYEKLTDNNGLKFTCETTSAKIYYNQKGGDPKESGEKVYGALALSVLNTKTIKAVAIVTVKGKEYYSDIVSEHYVISPIALFVTAKNMLDGKYAIYGNNVVASSFMENTATDNLKIVEADILKNKYIETCEFNGFTFTKENNSYIIQDAYDRYLYTGNGDKFNASKNKPATGATWSVSIDNNTSAATIKNTSSNKIIAYNKESENFGLYTENEIAGSIILPKLYKETEYPTITITPEAGDTVSILEKITVTCESGIIYEEPDFYTYAYYNIGWDYTKQEFYEIVEIDENTIEFIFDEPIKNTNEYKIVFPAGVFTLDPDGLAQTNKELIAKYTVLSKDILEITLANPANKDEVTSLQHLLFEFNQDIDIKITDAVITDKKGNEYPLTVSATDAWGGACGKNTLCLMSKSPITEAGEYTFVLKREYINATENKNLTIKNDIKYTFIINEALKIKSITPNNSNIYDSVDKITIVLNKNAMHENLAEIIVKDSKNNSYTFTKEQGTAEEATTLVFTTSTPLIDAGTYTFTIESNVIYCENTSSDIYETESIPETTFTFVIKQATSIKGIDATNKTVEIYDLTGRRIDNISRAGIYIINGKKVLKH